MSGIFSLADVKEPLLQGRSAQVGEEAQPVPPPIGTGAVDSGACGAWTRVACSNSIVGLYTGLRRNEILGLRGEHIDIANDLIYVAGVKSELDAGTKTEEDRERTF